MKFWNREITFGDQPFQLFHLSGYSTLLRCDHTTLFQGFDSWFRKLDRGIQTIRFQGSVSVGAFRLSKRVSDENRACSISIHFSKLLIRVSKGHFYCVCTIRVFDPQKIGSMKSDRVNRPLDGIKRIEDIDKSAMSSLEVNCQLSQFLSNVLGCIT